MSSCCDDTGCGAPQGADPAYRRVLWIALGINAAMFGVELIASMVAGSVSLQADALDFLGDAGNYAVSLIALGMAAVWRARAAIGKGVVMAGFGLWVAGMAIYHAVAGEVPRADVMSGIAAVALAANAFVGWLLFRFRAVDANAMSVWLCTRNDIIANVAVIVAGLGVWATGTRWPDILVGAIIATLGLTSAMKIIARARGELVALSPAHP